MWLWFSINSSRDRILVNAISLHSKEVILVKSVNDQMEPVETRLGFDAHADVSCARSDVKRQKARVCILDLWESLDREVDYSNYLVGYQLTKVVNASKVDHSCL